jgi:hypothetical protein
MRKSLAFSIAIIASLLQFAPSVAAENCAIGTSAIGVCKLPPHPKPERLAHPRHRAMEQRR